MLGEGLVGDRQTRAVAEPEQEPPNAHLPGAEDGLVEVERVPQPSLVVAHARMLPEDGKPKGNEDFRRTNRVFVMQKQTRTVRKIIVAVQKIIVAVQRIIVAPRKIIGSVQKIIVAVRKIIGAVQRIIVAVRKIIGAVRKIIVAVRKIIGSVQKIIGAVRKIIGSVQKVIVAVRKIIVAVQKTIGAVRKIIVAVRKIIGSVQKIIGAVQRIIVAVQRIRVGVRRVRGTVQEERRDRIDGGHRRLRLRLRLRLRPRLRFRLRLRLRLRLPRLSSADFSRLPMASPKDPLEHREAPHEVDRVADHEPYDPVERSRPDRAHRDVETSGVERDGDELDAREEERVPANVARTNAEGEAPVGCEVHHTGEEQRRNARDARREIERRSPSR